MSATRIRIDNDTRFEVAGYRGVAFYKHSDVIDHETRFASQDDADDHYSDMNRGICGCPVDREHIVAIMVGDDREHIVDLDDITVIADEDYCSGCGQTSCS